MSTVGGPPELSRGALAHVLPMETYQGPPIVVQVLDMQLITPKDITGPKRTKVIVSDGQYKCTALLASQLKDVVDSGAVTKGTILAVKDLVGNKKLGPSAAGGKKLLIFLGVDVIGHWGPVIGDPQPPPDVPDGPPPAGFAAGPPPAAGAYGAPQPNGNGMYGAPSMQQQQQPPNGNGMYGQPAQQQYGGGAPAHGNGVYGGPAGAGAPNGNGTPAGMYGAPAAAAAAGGGPAAGAGPAYGMGSGGGGPVAHSNEPLRITPVKALNPYLSRWTIKARCTQKGDIRRWSNPRSEGKLMSFDVVDADGSEIRVTAWNEQVEAFQEMVQVGRILQISKASLKPRNAKFNSTPHDYEIYLERSSVVTPCEEDAESAAIPHIMFHFRKLAELETLEAGAVIDVIGVVDSVAEWALITRKDGSETRKRTIGIRDDSGRSVEVTLWDRFTEVPGSQLEAMFKAGEHPVVAFKAVRVGDFNGKTLGSLGSSTILVAPDRPEAIALRQWYDQGGSAAPVATLSNAGAGGGMGRQDRRITFGQIKSEGLGCSGSADWVAVSGTINYIKSEQMTYSSCPQNFNGRPCQKKLQDQGAGSWFCERCNAACEQPVWRFLLSVQAQDHTDNQWLTAFGDAGETIMRRPAEAFAVPEALDNTEFGSIIADANFRPYMFKLKVLQDTYGDDQRVKVSISKIAPLDFVQEGRALLGLIQQLDAGQPILGPLAAAGGAPAPAGTPGSTRGTQFGGGGGFGGRGGPTQQQQQQFGTAPQQQQAQPQANQWGGGGGGAPTQFGGAPGGGGAGMYGGVPPAAAAAAPAANGGGGGGGMYNGSYNGGGGQQGQQQQFGQQGQQPGGWNAGGGGAGMYGGGGGGFQQGGGPAAYGQQQQQPPMPAQNFNQPFAAGWV